MAERHCRSCGAPTEAEARACPACGIAFRNYERDGQVIACVVVGLTLLILILT